MNHQKIYVHLANQKAHEAVQSDPRLMGSCIYATNAEAPAMMAIVYPAHATLRFDLATIEGVTVLAGPHDPTPIGADHAKKLGHVQAKATETMRSVALRFHVAHGPAFHPDV